MTFQSLKTSMMVCDMSGRLKVRGGRVEAFEINKLMIWNGVEKETRDRPPLKVAGNMKRGFEFRQALEESVKIKLALC